MRSRLEQESAVRNFYDREVAEEDQRLDDYPFEFAVTMRFISQYLATGARILDAACGTGRYAEALLNAGFRVGASDLSEANVRRTSERFLAKDFGDRLCFVRQGNALDAPSYAGGPWDGILLLGPCYHLPNEQDRVLVLRQAGVHLAPGGWLFVSFVSRMGAFWWGLEHRPEGILEKDGVRALLSQGTEFNFARPGEGLPNCYFCDPGELDGLFRDAGLVPKHICGTEGVFGGRVSRFHALSQPLRDAWLEFTLEHCEAPIFRWASEHLLVVAQRE
jgi:2-polyprenyl-3-methyl-5-hydroxy-6-metoxy-1,4-benzoquinol methylase